MNDPRLTLLVVLGLVGAAFLGAWISLARRDPRPEGRRPNGKLLGIGFVTDFFDTWGIGSFATTTTAFRLLRAVPDQLIPGTLNVGHAFPTILQAIFFIKFVEVDLTTLIAMIVAAVLGSWLGAGVVCRLPRRKVQIGMAFCLLAAAVLLLMTQLKVMPSGGNATGLTGKLLVIGIVGNFVLGSLMSIGIGLYAPCMVLVSLLGMHSDTAFPIMMGSCAFLMPISGVKFIRERSYHLGAAVALAVGGVPAVWLAVEVVTKMSMDAVRWLVIVVVVYTGITLLWAARKSPSDDTVARA